jgi:hypothetical protein
MNNQYKRYCIDTSALVDAWQDMYRPASFPTFWERLDDLIESGALIAPEDVRQELKYPAELNEWARRRDRLFRELDGALQDSLRVVLADFYQLMRKRKYRILATELQADPVVVALARTEECTVVAHEKPRGNQGRPKIPDLCSRHGLKCIRLSDVIEQQGWSF